MRYEKTRKEPENVPDGTEVPDSDLQETGEDGERVPEEPRRRRHVYTKTTVAQDEMQSRQDAKQRRRLIFYILLFAVILIAFLAVSFFVFFRISEIRVIGNAMYTEEQIMEYVSFHTGDNLFSFDAEKTEAALRRNLPYIGDVTVSRKLPSTVTIDVSERTEDLALRLGEEIYLVAGDLQVLGRYGANEVIPNITKLYTGSVERCIVGERLTFLEGRADDNLKYLYRCLEANRIQKKVRTIDITSRFDITISYDDRFTVYLGSAEDMDIKIQFLVAILERLGSSERGYINLSDCREAAVRLED